MISKNYCAKLSAARIRAIRSYENNITNPKAFVKAVKTFGKLEQQLTDWPIWNRGIFSEEEENRAFCDSSFSALATLIWNGEINQ